MRRLARSVYCLSDHTMTDTCHRPVMRCVWVWLYLILTWAAVFVSSQVPFASNCNFDVELLCGFVQQTVGDDFDWEVGSGAVEALGLSGDHTGGGSYAYFNTTGKTRSQTAILRSMQLASLTPHCLTFYYYMAGADVGSLAVLQQRVGEQQRTELWSAEGDQGHGWKRAKVDVTSPLDGTTPMGFRINFDAVVGSGQMGLIAIDDVVFVNGPCDSDGCNVPLGMENGWITDDQITASSADVDFPTSSARLHGNGCWIPSIPQSSRLQVEFATSMILTGIRTQGFKTGWITKYMVEYSETLTSTWIACNAFITTDQLTGNSDADSVVEHMFTGRLQAQRIRVTPLQFHMRPSLRLEVIGCDYGTCTFDSSPCGYIRNPSIADFMWTWKLPTGAEAWGPTSDHTAGAGGSFLLADATGRHADDTAILSTEVLPPALAKCVEFFYHMNSPAVGALNVYLKRNDMPLAEAVAMTPARRLVGQQGDGWRRGGVEVTADFPYEVVFQAVIGQGDIYGYGDIGLDDVTVREGLCPWPEFDDCLSSPCLNNDTCTDGKDNYTCTCGEQFYGRNCEHVSACVHGVNLALTNSVTEGYITSPNYPGDYPNNADCYWTITAPSAIQLDFVGTFDVEPGPNCPYDYVRVLDGQFTSSPILGTFCGTYLPPTMRTVGNVITVQFHSDYSEQRAGFRAKYSIAIPCPPLTSPANGALSSAGPHYHPDVVTVTCNQGYEPVGDSSLTCQADGIWSSDVPTCTHSACLHGESLVLTDTVTEGFIFSPNYPGDNYPSDANCLWTITAPLALAVQLEFVDTFEIEFYEGLTCYDYIKVFERRISPSSALGTFCGTSLPVPPIVRTVGNVMKVQFRTDSDRQHAGFRAKYSVAETPTNVTTAEVPTTTAQNGTDPNVTSVASETLPGVPTEKPIVTMPTVPSVVEGGGEAFAMLECTGEYMQIVFSRSHLPDFDTGNLHLMDPSCKATGNATHIILTAPFEGCGTVKTDTESEIIYFNKVLSTDNDGVPFITRIRELEVPFECRMDSRDTVSAVFSPQIEKIYFFRSAHGKYNFDMLLFTSVGFQQQIETFPYVVQLNQPLYVQVQVLTPDQDLQLFAENCMATPSANILDPMSYTFISDGCPVDSTFLSLFSSSQKQERFSINSFAFVEDYPEVYLHCTVLVCNSTDPTSRCAQGCLPPPSRHKRAAPGAEPRYNVYKGPILYPAYRRPSDMEAVEENRGARVPPGVVTSLVIAVGLLLCAVVTLVGVIAYMRMRTDRKELYMALPTDELE